MITTAPLSGLLVAVLATSLPGAVLLLIGRPYPHLEAGPEEVVEVLPDLGMMIPEATVFLWIGDVDSAPQNRNGFQSILNGQFMRMGINAPGKSRNDDEAGSFQGRKSFFKKFKGAALGMTGTDNGETEIGEVFQKIKISRARVKIEKFRNAIPVKRFEYFEFRGLNSFWSQHGIRKYKLRARF
jgi:hypothetical protein